MMNWVRIFSTSVGVLMASSQTFAESYGWADRRHTCTAIAANYATANGLDREAWIDAPVEFSIRSSKCSQYHDAEKPEGERHPNVLRRIHDCEQRGSHMDRFQVVELYPEFLGAVPLTIPSRLTAKALATNSGVLFNLGADGWVDVGRLSRSNDVPQNAWWIARAKCVPVD